ncbi:MAG TPA: hypothetical protein VFX02_14165 [Gammaproteobacteria bacterium]|nr:hypothetical protein [Gammaproteobacteria bacterium]
MKPLKLLLVGIVLFIPAPVFAVQVEICNQSRFLLEVTEGSKLLADAEAGQCLELEIREREKWLINFGMTRYMYHFLHLNDCAQDGKAKLIATDDGRLYCNSQDQAQPKGFPMEVMQKIDLI